MPASFYQELFPSDVSIGFRNLIDWLLGTSRGDLTGGATAGPAGVTLIEADDGTLREVPGAGVGFLGLGSGNLWRTGATLPLGAWCVVQLPGTLGQALQIFFQIDNNTVRIGYQMIPLADWATGGGSTTTPTKPATVTPATIVISPANLAVGATFRAACDPGVFCAVYDDGSTNDAHLLYAGEVDDPDNDSHPFVINGDMDSIGADDWARLSPIDDSTQLGPTTNGQLWCWGPYNNNAFLNSSEIAYNSNGNRPGVALGVGFDTVSHDHIAGTLRYLRGIHEGVTARATMTDVATDDLIVFNTFGTSTLGLLMAWDGATPYT